MFTHRSSIFQSVISLLILVLCASGTAAAAAPNEVAAPAAAPKATDPLVLTFYYPWYGTPDGPGGVRHGKKIVHWETIDAAAKKISASTNYPIGGAYDSHDPAVIARHCTLAKDTGIDGLIISWWGKDSFEDQAVPAILDGCAKAAIHACIYYEQVPSGGTPATVAAEITEIIHRYGDHAAYLKVTQGGIAHPVVFIYSRAVQQLGIDKWKQVQEILSHMDPRPLLIGDDFSAKAVNTFDGAHAYGPAGDVAAAIKRGESVHTWASHAIPWWANCGEGGAAAHKAGKISCVTVFPGYDDTHVRKPGLVVQRGNGTLYEELWSQAVAAKPDWVVITSFNEWHEGSEIEPSVEEGDAYIKMTKEWAEKFKTARQQK